MNRLVPLLCLFALIAPAAAAQVPEPRGEAQALLSGAMADSAVPAMGLLIIRYGQVVDTAVHGVRALGAPDPVQITDRWNLGSDGKAMTVTVIARLVDRGLLDWSTPLAEMLPDLAAGMRPEYRSVTLLDLLSHRAGLPANISDLEAFWPFFDDDRPLPQQRLAYLRLTLAEAPVGPPRADSVYSNTDLIVAAAIAERVTGTAFEQLLQDEVFGPLGMDSARLDQTPGADEPRGHVDGRIADQARDGNPAMLIPAGGVRMSLADWARFCIDQIRGEHGEGVLLQDATYRLMHTAQGETASGLGWGVAPRIAGRAGPVLTHAGSDGNWYALVALFPGSGNGVLVTANAGESMGGDAAALGVARAVLVTLAPPVAETPATP